MLEYIIHKIKRTLIYGSVGYRIQDKVSDYAQLGGRQILVPCDIYDGTVPTRGPSG